MHIFRSIACAPWLALVLVACDGPRAASTESDLDAASEVPSEETPSEMVVASDGAWPAEFVDTDNSPLTAQEILGMWSIAPNCAQPTIFMPDGTYTDYSGHTGSWVLDGDRLTMGRAVGEYVNEVNQFDANTFAVGAPSAEIAPGALRTVAIYRRCS